MFSKIQQDEETDQQKVKILEEGTKTMAAMLKEKQELVERQRVRVLKVYIVICLLQWFDYRMN